MALRKSLLMIVCASGLWAQSPDPNGTWTGALDVDGNKLTLVLHATRAPDGTIRATLDSPDQGATGLPISDFRVTEDGGISWELKQAGGRFEGTLKGDEMAGRWKQGQLDAPLTLKRGSPAAAASQAVIEEGAPSPFGVWEGTLKAGAASLRMVLRVQRGPEGSVRTVMDSPDQGAKDLPVSNLRVTKDGKVSWEFRPGQGRFEGTITATEMTGTWSQGGMRAPLTLKKVEQASTRPRPQVPQPPFPYLEEQVAFEGGDEGVRLAGTLTKPKGTGPFPAAILISGSGPQDRDETVFEHKPFLVLADHLTRRGIAVLRYDDRGVSKSTGHFGEATSADFAEDAAAALRFLRDRGDIKSGHVGLIGHSEGAMIASMLAARDPEVKFVVLLAGLGVPGHQVLQTQASDIGRANGMSAELIAKLEPLNEEVYSVLKSDLPDAEAQAKIKEILARTQTLLTEVGRKQVSPYFQAPSQNVPVTPWLRFFVRYDPAPDLKKIQAPVLALAGGKDIQVKAEPNIAGIRAALKAGGNQDVTAKILPDLNHLFQTAKTGRIDEYARIEETFSPSALKKIGDWIVAHTMPGD